MKKIIYLTALTYTFCLYTAKPNRVITYDISGRFGDSLVSYCKARWLFKKYGIEQFRYSPFEYSKALKLSTTDPVYNHKEFSTFKQVSVIYEKDTDFNKFNTFYRSHSYCRVLNLIDEEHGYFSSDYTESFINELRDLVTPIVPLQLLEIPSGILSLAIHVRRGGGADLPLFSEQPEGAPRSAKHYIDVGFPTKFPPHKFYIDQIIKVSELFPQQPIYAFLFTDDKNPERIASIFEKAINNPNIVFDYRKQGNAHNAYVLEDFFSMLKFDCLIRPDSNFSKVGQLIGNYKLVICPKHFKWENNNLIINEVEIYTQQAPFFKEDASKKNSL